jgi:predicted AAA+ superfamily ATPase
MRGAYDSDLIKVIIGIRRSGKSVLLGQIMQEIRNRGIRDDHIIYLNFEDYSYDEYTNPKLFHKYIKSQIKDEAKYYLFFDEIQEVDEFEKVINSFRATLNSSIFITGSNSKLLVGDFSTRLSGRYLRYRMLPLVFSEYLELIGNVSRSKDELFDDYLHSGGMPQVYAINDGYERKLYLTDLYNSIILKDIITRHDIKDPNLLNRIVQFLMENIGQITSGNSIAGYLKNERISTTVNTVLNYIDHICEAMVFDKVSRYDIRGKSVLATLDKYYISDPGFLQLKKSQIEEKRGGRLENTVYNELISRGFTVNVGKTIGGKVDFVATRFGELQYIQVAEYLSDDAVLEREFGSLRKIDDNLKKLVLTRDRTDHSRAGIEQRNIVDWLTEPETPDH